MPRPALGIWPGSEQPIDDLLVSIGGSDPPQQRAFRHVIGQDDWPVLATAPDGLARVEAQLILLLERAATRRATLAEQRLDLPKVIRPIAREGASLCIAGTDAIRTTMTWPASW